MCTYAYTEKKPCRYDAICFFPRFPSERLESFESNDIIMYYIIMYYSPWSKFKISRKDENNECRLCVYLCRF